MHYPKITLAIFILPTALALPSSGHGHGHHHHHGYEAYKSGKVSGAPSASATTGAPYGLSNGTVGAASTGSGANTNYQIFTLQSTQYLTVYASNSEAPSESATAVGASGAGTCGSTSTVTVSPTTTVTVTGNSAPAESGVESSAPTASSTAAPVESSAPVVSSTVAPVVSASPEAGPVAPVASSPAPAPETSSAPAPTQAATSASVTPSVTPIDSSPVVSVTPATPAAAVAPSGNPSGGSAANYCLHDGSDIGGKVIPPTWSGANYTGGVAGTKRGIVFVAGKTPDKAGLASLANNDTNIHWLGNYYSGAPGGLAKHVEFVPQMYGLDSTNDWSQHADAAVKNNTKYFLSFGEPGTPNPKLYQTPNGAAQFYMDQMNRYAKEGVTIGAPGCLGGPQDWQWDQQFLCQCQGLGCDIGFIAGHWFDAAAPLEQQVERAKGTVETYIAVAKGKPVWMDNIWAKGTDDEQKAFMNVMIPWLEKNPAIQRYGWVSQDVGKNPFVDGSGTITELGTWFLNFKYT